VVRQQAVSFRQAYGSARLLPRALRAVKFVNVGFAGRFNLLAGLNQLHADDA
jgi:hypothetical protein